ncbi:DegT/DnrJ/EryC1/StrS family aminotransferase [Bacillus cereus]
MPQTSSSWHLYIIRLNTKLLNVIEKNFTKRYKRENIGVNVHYTRTFVTVLHQKLGYEKGICPQAENVYEEIITLPLFPKMTEADVWDVLQAVRKSSLFYSVAKN